MKSVRFYSLPTCGHSRPFSLSFCLFLTLSHARKCSNKDSRDAGPGQPRELDDILLSGMLSKGKQDRDFKKCGLKYCKLPFLQTCMNVCSWKPDEISNALLGKKISPFPQNSKKSPWSWLNCQSPQTPEKILLTPRKQDKTSNAHQTFFLSLLLQAKKNKI